MGLARLGLGIDVGGTFTDAVLINMNSREVLGFSKSPTARGDLSSGIEQAVAELDYSLFPRIQIVTLSTTLATNAIVEGARRAFAAILIGYRDEHCPPEFRNEIFRVQGGHDVRGEERAPLRDEEIREVLEKTASSVHAYAVSGFFSSRNPAHELHVKDLIEGETDIPVVCGHEISLKLNAIVRATTTILNANLIPIVKDLFMAVREALSRFAIHAPLMVVKGDGTLVSESVALRKPIETVLSGPAASVMGAKHLMKTLDGIENGLVVDIGGTTSDLAFLEKGMPRLNPKGARIGKWQTHVTAVETWTIGLGGDSHIQCDGDGHLSIGPRRVIPLSILAHKYPGVKHELARIDGSFIHSKIPAQVDHWVGHDRGVNGSMTTLQRKLAAHLFERPQSIFQLARHLDVPPGLLLEDLASLETRGIVLRSGFTLTDMFHLTGSYGAGDSEAATFGASVLAKRVGTNREQLLIKIRVLFHVRLGLQILSILNADKTDFQRGMEACPSCRSLWGNCFSESNETDPSIRKDRYAVRIILRDPVIGLGAPAHALVPPLAEKLGTRGIIPPYAEVANALGAVTSVVAVRRELSIVPENGKGFRVVGLPCRASFRNLDEAEAHARTELERLVAEEARRAGAGHVEIRVEAEEKNIATAYGGLFMEKVITVFGVGTPSIGSCVSSDLSLTEEPLCA